MQTITFTNGKSFRSEAGETVLDAALRSNIAMPYSCRTGRCNSCKSKVIAGSSSIRHTESGLSDGEKDAGWILSCARTAESDLLLELGEVGDWVMPAIKTLPCRISAVDRLASDVVRVTLRLPPTSDFHFFPGQYIDVIGNGGVRRSYSIAGADAGAKTLELHIRATEGGEMSKYWFDLAKQNDLLRLNGPLGTFFLRGLSQRDLIFLATGTGIAPVKAMLEGLQSLPADEQPRSVSVYWGGRTHADLYFDPTSAGAPHRYTPVLSRAGAGWLGKRGHVQDVLMDDRPMLSESVVYACGSDAMIQNARALLTGAGLPEQRFNSDAFVCSSVS